MNKTFLELQFIHFAAAKPDGVTFENCTVMVSNCLEPATLEAVKPGHFAPFHLTLPGGEKRHYTVTQFEQAVTYNESLRIAHVLKKEVG